MHEPKPSRRLRSRKGTRPRKGEGEQRILRVALNHFGQYGFDGTSTIEIARQAGISRPLIYFHFKNKEELWRRAVEFGFKIAAQSIAENDGERENLAASRPPLESVLRNFTIRASRSPELFNVFLQEGRVGGKRLKYLMSRYLTPIFDSIEGALRDADGQGDIRSVPRQHFLFILLGAANHMALIPHVAKSRYGVDAREEKQIEAYAATLADVLMNGIARKS